MITSQAVGLGVRTTHEIFLVTVICLAVLPHVSHFKVLVARAQKYGFGLARWHVSEAFEGQSSRSYFNEQYDSDWVVGKIKRAVN
jgi:hypothetical protein